jgi:hypothetical protein
VSINSVSGLDFCDLYAQDPFERELQSWVEEKQETDEYDSRLRAAEKIRECYVSQGACLDLNMGMLTSLPEAIGRLRSLKCLRVLHNQLESLPEAIGNLRSLETLDLSGNHLESLPESIGNLENLRTLWLLRNRFASIPVVAFGNLKSLVTLHLENNHFVLLPAEIGNLHNLRELYLDNNQLLSVPEEIFNLPRTCMIDLTGCPFSDDVLEIIRSRVFQGGYRGPSIHHPDLERVIETSESRTDEDGDSSNYEVLEALSYLHPFRGFYLMTL